MTFLRNFTLLDELQEHSIVCYEERRQIFNNYYPLHLFSTKEFSMTIFVHSIKLQYFMVEMVQEKQL